MGSRWGERTERRGEPQSPLPPLDHLTHPPAHAHAHAQITNTHITAQVPRLCPASSFHSVSPLLVLCVDPFLQHLPNTSIPLFSLQVFWLCLSYFFGSLLFLVGSLGTLVVALQGGASKTLTVWAIDVRRPWLGEGAMPISPISSGPSALLRAGVLASSLSPCGPLVNPLSS
jgi:hypothetical protein